MRVLLTGANGFIGSHLTAVLLQDGYEVVAAVREPAKFLRRFPSATALAVDFNHARQIEDWTPLLIGVDAVVNCAGILQSRARQKAQAVHSEAPIALFRAAHQLGIAKIIQISAVSIGADTEYARTKLAADEALQSLNADWVILRPSLVYGRTAYGGTAMLRALAACPFIVPLIGDGGQLATPIHLNDLCSTIHMALSTPVLNRRIISPCGPETLSLRQIILSYRSWLGLPEPLVLAVPQALTMLAARIGDWFGSGPLTTTALRQLEFGNAADPAAFNAATSIEPKSMHQMLQIEPASTAELWHARLYLVRPLVRATLILLWAVSGLTGLLASASSIEAVFNGSGLDTGFALTAGRMTSAFDLAIAAMLLLGRWPRLAFAAQLIAVTSYTFILTLIAPQLWGDLFGPLLKNIPILVLIMILRLIEEER